jgi:hypothetical protein
MRSLGWEPRIPVEQNIREYLAWMKPQLDESISARGAAEAERVMREQGVLRRASIAHGSGAARR